MLELEDMIFIIFQVHLSETSLCSIGCKENEINSNLWKASSASQLWVLLFLYANLFLRIEKNITYLL